MGNLFRPRLHPRIRILTHKYPQKNIRAPMPQASALYHFYIYPKGIGNHSTRVRDKRGLNSRFGCRQGVWRLLLSSISFFYHFFKRLLSRTRVTNKKQKSQRLSPRQCVMGYRRLWSRHQARFTIARRLHRNAH